MACPSGVLVEEKDVLWKIRAQKQHLEEQKEK
jgi:hypothetical protein